MKDTDQSCRHLAYVEADFESMRRGGSCRTAMCLCGWKGPQRGTLELAVDDALTHEQSTFCIAETVQGSAIRRATARRPQS